MNLRQCREMCQADANKYRSRLALVRAPIETAEEQGDYGYCPEYAVPLLFRYGTVIEIITPDKES